MRIFWAAGAAAAAEAATTGGCVLLLCCLRDAVSGCRCSSDLAEAGCRCSLHPAAVAVVVGCIAWRWPTTQLVLSVCVSMLFAGTVDRPQAEPGHERQPHVMSDVYVVCC